MNAPVFAAPLCAFEDVPAAAGMTIRASELYFEGWAINQSTGQRPSAFVLSRRTWGSDTIVLVPVRVDTVPRPDVQAAFGGSVSSTLGWRLWPQSPQPSGDYEYTVLISDAPASAQSVSIAERVIVIP